DNQTKDRWLQRASRDSEFSPPSLSLLESRQGMETMADVVDSPQLIQTPSVNRRGSTEKPPILAFSSSFERLPDEIIEQILRLTDPNSFASLVLLNSKWRAVSQQAHLYEHQLSQCPSYAASHKTRRATPTSDDDLPDLRRLFAREVKRNLFDAYLRPSLTVIKLVSNSISSSSCPGGEGMQFHPSPRGHQLLAYNSSRIYVIDAREREIKVKRELKILRRPAATCIMDDGSLLAVLLTEMQVDLYDLTQSPPKRTQSIILDNSPRAIALSPCGSVLAAAYEGGIEVSSLSPGAMGTERRAVKCDAVDALAFSFDGTQILGTTVQSTQPNTVILTAPYYDAGSHMESDNMSGLWTTSILFPNTSRDCSHAVLLQDSNFEEATWAFTYDRSFETFRAVRIDDLRNGTTYFTGPVPSKSSQGRLLPCTLPAASYRGDLVAAGFQGKDIWVYGVPEDLDAAPEPPSKDPEHGSPDSTGLRRRGSGPSTRSTSRGQENADERVPQWQLLCDKLRNTFIAGSKVAELSGAGTVKWVAGFGDSPLKERLIVGAKGLSNKPASEEDEFDFADGGRLTLIDFDYGVEDGQVTEITIEVGDAEPEVLEEETRDMETEVAIVRRRTVAQRRGNQSSVMRAATTAARLPPVPLPPMPRRTKGDDADDPLVSRRTGVPPVPQRTETGGPLSEDGDGQSLLDPQEALEDPYSQTGPRSGPTLRRAATAAANHRRFHPSGPEPAAVQFRRVDGRQGPPHESDADNWVPPPPPYQKENPIVDLPSFLRHNNIPPAGDTNTATPPVPPIPSQISHQASRSNPVLPIIRQTAPNRLSSHDGVLATNQQRHASDSSVGRSRSIDAPQPSPSTSGLGIRDNEDIYDVSPPGTPNQSGPRPPTIPRHSTDSSGHLTTTPNRTPKMSTPVAPSPVVSNMGQDTPTPAPAVFTPSTIASTPAVGQGGQGGPPLLDLQIPTSALSPSQMWNSLATATSDQQSASARVLSNSQTWPKQASSDKPSPAVSMSTAGIPQSAPATNFDPNEAIAQAQQLPQPGAARSATYGASIQPPAIPSQRQRQPYSPSQHPLQQNPITPRVPHAQQASPVPPPETPLIISTPRGIMGAFDAPGSAKQAEPRPETPLVSPVPRHPRASPGSSGPGFRPAAERLEGMYNSSSSIPRPPHDFLNVPLVPASPMSSGATSRAASASVLGRRKSRAERSAARNMSDAKKRGWRRSKSKRGKKKGANGDNNNNQQQQHDAAAFLSHQQPDVEGSSAQAWTEISAPPPGVLGPQSSANAAMSAYQDKKGGSRLSKHKKDHKCIVM
ncbi:hypothetical protein PpBr36_05283, partial [Pyricularia pennisetigena]|uniref:hypothetical protein n=1 Tax=Pyricularia pennisetigena TaxID=1578925 RepID=UPI0011536D8C